MDEVESELQSAAQALQTQLRQGRGFDEERAERLKKAHRAAARAWADRDVISKSAANLVVELGWCLDGCSDIYRGEKAGRIKQLAHELTDLVRASVRGGSAGNLRNMNSTHGWSCVVAGLETSHEGQQIQGGSELVEAAGRVR